MYGLTSKSWKAIFHCIGALNKLSTFGFNDMNRLLETFGIKIALKSSGTAYTSPRPYLSQNMIVYGRFGNNVLIYLQDL